MYAAVVNNGRPDVVIYHAMFTPTQRYCDRQGRVVLRHAALVALMSLTAQGFDEVLDLPESPRAMAGATSQAHARKLDTKPQLTYRS
jgi:hypothetical protein